MSVPSAHAQRVVELVRAGSSVEVVGGRWSGRTRLVERVHRDLTAAGVAVVTIRGTGPALPLEALRHALAGQGARTAGELPGTVAAVADALGSALRGERTAILVDDADLLDEASRAVVLGAHHAQRCPLVATGPPRREAGPWHPPAGRVRLPLVRVALDPLRAEQVHSLLEEHLEAVIAPAVTARVHTTSGGVPGLAVAILDAAVARGHVAPVDGVWRAAGPLRTDELDAAYAALLAPHAPEVRDAVETLALSGSVDVDAAVALVGGDALEEAEDLGLVRTFRAGDRLVVAVTPPGLADHLRHRRPSARRHRIAAAARSRPQPPGPARPSDGAGAPVDARDLALVARMLSERHRDLQDAAAAAWRAQPDTRHAARYLALHLCGAEGVVPAEAVRARTRSTGDEDPADVVAYRYLLSRCALADGAGTGEAAALLIDDLPEGFAHAGALEALALATRYAGEALPPGYEARLAAAAGASRAGRTGGAGSTGAVDRVVLAMCHALAGRAEDALATARAVADAPPLLRVHAELATGVALDGAGRFREASAAALAGLHRALSAGDHVGFVAHTYVVALASAALGHRDAARDALDVVLSSGLRSGVLLWCPDAAIRTLTALLAAPAARGAAGAFLDEAAAEQLPSPGLPMGSAGWGEAIRAVDAGDPGTAARRYRAVSDAARDRGFVLAADTAAMCGLLACFDATEARRFRPRARALGGDLYAAYLDARTAAHDRAPERLVAAAEVMRREGAATEAARFFAEAARGFRDTGDVHGAARARTLARETARETPDPPSGRAPAPAVALTRRDSQVVDLVAAGMSNQDIAAATFLSVRTVESHLRNIRRKTGAIDREDLATFRSGP